MMFPSVSDGELKPHTISTLKIGPERLYFLGTKEKHIFEKQVMTNIIENKFDSLNIAH